MGSDVNQAMSKKYYTVYDNRTDEVVAFGSAVECTQKLGLKDLRQFYAFCSKTKSGIRRNHSVVVEDLKASKTEDENET